MSFAIHLKNKEPQGQVHMRERSLRNFVLKHYDEIERLRSDKYSWRQIWSAILIDRPEFEKMVPHALPVYHSEIRRSLEATHEPENKMP